MRLAVLTTETLHHAHFVRALNAGERSVVAFIEPPVPARYETGHAFEIERDASERRRWFDGAQAAVCDFADVEACNDINSAAKSVRSFSPDLTIAFGARIIKGEMFRSCPLMFNLHGGDPCTYRGSDTHLWAIWHRAFDALKTCLHVLTPDLDAGDIAGIEPVPIARNMKLAELRAANTELCIALVERAISELSTSGRIKAFPQQGAGRVYSHMPAVLKDICVRRFERYTGTLDDGLRGAPAS